MDSGFRVNPNQLYASPLENSFLQLPSNSKRRDQNRSAITRSQRFVALPNAANNIVA